MILKHKRIRHFKFRDRRNQVKPMTSEPTRTYIATVSMAPGETIALPANIDTADPAIIAAAVEAAEAARRDETQRLREMFLGDKDKGAAK
jgi:hypothetical protein